MLEGKPALTFLGDLAHKPKPCEEYTRYASELNPSVRNYHKGAREEFSKCLHETSLDPDDVEGIRKVSI